MDTRLVIVYSFILLISGVSCSSGGGGGSNTTPTLPTVTESGTVKATEGAKVVTTDAKLSATILSGALAVDTEISITPLTSNDGYSLKPDGTQFSEPVTLDLDIDTSTTTINDTAGTPITLSGALVAPVPYVVSSDGTVEALQNVKVTRDLSSPTIRLSGSLTHFSELRTDLANGVFVFTMDYTANQTEGSSFNTVLNLKKYPSGTISGIIPVSSWSAGPVVWTTEGALSVVTSSYTFNSTSLGPVTQAFSCAAEGSGKIIAKLTATVASSVTTKPATIDLTLTANVNCAAAPAAGVVTEGTIDLSAVTGTFEGLNIRKGCSGMFDILSPNSPPRYGILSTKSVGGQSVVIDLTNKQVASGVSAIGGAFGTDCISSSDPTATGCVLLYGDSAGWGYTCFYEATQAYPTNDFGMTMISPPSTPPIYFNDITTNTTNPDLLGSGFAATSANTVEWMSGYDHTTGLWPSNSTLASGWFGVSSVSMCAVQGGFGGSQVMIVGNNGTQGELWFGDPTTTGTLVGNLGIKDALSWLTLCRFQ